VGDRSGGGELGVDFGHCDDVGAEEAVWLGVCGFAAKLVQLLIVRTYFHDRDGADVCVAGGGRTMRCVKKASRKVQTDSQEIDTSWREVAFGT